MLVAQQKEQLDALMRELKSAPAPGRRLAVEALAGAMAELNMWRRGDKAKARALMTKGTTNAAYNYWVTYVYRELQGATWVQFHDSIHVQRPEPILTARDRYRLVDELGREFRKGAALLRVLDVVELKGES